jgi:hypothetical protein
MNGFSEVSRLFASRAGDIEQARGHFIAESRALVEAVLQGVKKSRSDPWHSKRARIDFGPEVEESKMTGYFNSQYARGQADLRFLKGLKHMAVATVRFGIDYKASAGCFVWRVTLVPGSKYDHLDDALWQTWNEAGPSGKPAGAEHLHKQNMVVFAYRPLDESFSVDVALEDAKMVLEFLLTPVAEQAIGRIIGNDQDGEGASSTSA